MNPNTPNQNKVQLLTLIISFAITFSICTISDISTTSTDSFKAWDAPGFVAYHEPTTTDILERKRTDDQKRAETRAQFRG